MFRLLRFLGLTCEGASEFDVGRWINVWEGVLESQVLRRFHRFRRFIDTFSQGGRFAPVHPNGYAHGMQELTMKQAELEKIHVEILKLMADG
ncbi:hypothetical protein D3C73_540950 [compost metagenome]